MSVNLFIREDKKDNEKWKKIKINNLKESKSLGQQ